MSDYWLNAPTFAPLDTSPAGFNRKRNTRVAQLLGGPRQKEETPIDKMLAAQRTSSDAQDGGLTDETAVGEHGLYPEAD